MTQNQLDWMLSRGLDPNEYDMTPAGRVFRKQPAVVEEPQREVMSKPRAFGTSFLGNLLPSAAGLGGAKLGMEGGAALGAFGGPYAPVTVPIGAILGAISGGLGAGYLGGKAQEAVLEKVAPEAIAEMQRAYTDQPVASYVGGFAPSALAFRPSLQGMGALLQPTKRGTATLGEALTNPNFLAPASNIAANVGASSAGQLINVAEGGEFSAPRFAADVVLGTLFNRPTALGRAMGFKDMPQGRPVERPNLAAATERTSQERADIERMTGEMDLAAQNLEQLRQTPAAAERVGEEIRTPEQYFTPEGKPLTEERRVRDYSKWWKSETEPTTELIKGAAEEVQMKVPKDKLAELANDPEVGEVLRDPSKMEAFVAKQADQTLEDVYQMMQRRRAREFATAEEAANQKAFRELQAERDLTQKTITPEAMELLGKVDKGGVPGFITNNLRRIAQENGIVVTDADTPNTVIQRLRDLATLSDVEAAYAASKVNAADAAREVYTRLQRAPEEGPRKITQQDVDFAAEVAARRGLKIELERAFAGDKEVRGMYFTDPKTGDRIIRVNPLMATPDTAIHEVGHDIFRGVTNTGMRRSLMETAMDSPAYKSELAAREAEVKAGFLTPEKAQEIALEEGLIQAFGEQVPNINRGELRAWFAAFKASMKQLVTGKMTPQDALAWMHYASMEAVPWKGVAVAKPGEERMQRGPVDDTAYLKAVDKAVESGDTAEVQRMVDEAARKAGFDLRRLYHGTPFGKFSERANSINTSRENLLAVRAKIDQNFWAANDLLTEARQKYGRYHEQTKQAKELFDAASKEYDDIRQNIPLKEETGDVFRYVQAQDPGYLGAGFYFTADKNLAESYSKFPTRARQPGDLSPYVYETYLSLKNPYTGTEPIISPKTDIAAQYRLKGLRDIDAIKREEGRILRDRLIESGFDGVIRDYGEGTEYVAFYPEQIKSADPITRDDAGNVIPLSKRFQTDNPDIRYQRAQQETPEFKNWFGESKVVNEQGEPLVVYHGTDADFTSFRQAKEGTFGKGIYVTPNPEFASSYAAHSAGGDKRGKGGNVMPLYASLKNPIEIIDDGIHGPIEVLKKLGYTADKASNIWEKALESKGNLTGQIQTKAQLYGHDGIMTRYPDGRIREIVLFYPEQVKSATGNRGTFDPLSKDIRYQRSLASEAGTPAEIEYLAKRGGVRTGVANDLRAAYNTRDYTLGQWSSKYSKTMALRPEDQVRLLNHLAGEFDSGIRSTPAPELREAYDQIRNEHLPTIVNEYNNAGFKVRDTAGLRARGSNPTYFPLHVIADDVKAVLTTQQGSPEFVKLKDDFIKWNTQLKQADGATLQEAQKYALDKFNESQAITAQRPGIESGIPFSGARKPEGYPLPPSWRSNDIVDILDKYTKRSATDFAYQKHVESSPVTMAALGAKTMVNDQPIPANILQNTDPIINDPSVQSILREYRGTPAQKTEGMLQSFGRFVTAATIGTVSKVVDIGTSMFKGLAYLSGSEYVGGLSDFTNRIANWSALKERSYASGLNKRDAAENMRQVLGIAEDSTAFMDKAARLLSKATFVNDLESVARTIAQGWGETVIGINKKLALGGDKNAAQMLDTLSPDWRTRPDADLAAQVGRLLQGSYDMRQLPASVLEGAAAPYLTWSKWSIGQYNNFLNYAIKPAMQGNMKPLIGQMLIGLLGGGAISAVQEWINNREGKDITWKELEAWMQQNQGELGADGGQLLGQKLLTMAQKMGTFGFAGDLAKMVLDSAAGGTAQGVATMPAMDAIYDVAKRAAAAGKALDDGEDFGLVMKALIKDSLVGHVQVLRVARNWLDEDENLRYDDRRRRRLYDELTGAPSRGGAFTVNYSNLSEREFERGEISPQTGEEAFNLVSRAREESATPEEYASRIRKYKTAQNEIMPSLERQPMKAARYLSWLEGAEEGAGAETMRRYMIREQENKYRKSLIEGLSGLR